MRVGVDTGAVALSSDESPVSISSRVSLMAGELLSDAVCVGQAGLVQHGVITLPSSI